MASLQQYPCEILPRQGWCQCIGASTIIESCPEAILGRKLDGNLTQCIDMTEGEERSTIYMNALPVSSIPNLSCSLLGAFFKPNHFHFLPTNAGKAPWNEDDIVTEDNIEGNYQYFETITVVGWSLFKVHKYSIGYKHVFNKPKDYNQFRQAAITVAKDRNLPLLYLQEWNELTNNPLNEKQRIVEVSGEARVNHAPTRLNFWHFTIDQYPAEDNIKPLKNASEGWRNNLALNLCDFLRHSFVLITDDTSIPTLENEQIWVKPV